MSTIFLDPGTMDATAGGIGERAQEIQTTVATLESTCCANVPVALAGWLAEELHEIAVQSQLVALVYTVAALDTALRARQIQADQSLVAAQPELVSTSVDLNTALAMGSVVGGDAFSVGTVTGMSTDLTIAWVGGSSDLGIDPGTGIAPTISWVGGSSDLGIDPGTGIAPIVATIGPPTYANDPFMQMAIRLQDSNPALSAQMLGVSSSVSESQYNGIKNLLAPSGLSFVGNNTYEDNFGRSGGLGATYRDPSTGDLRF